MTARVPSRSLRLPVAARIGSSGPRFLVWTVVVSTAVAFIGGPGIAGFGISGLAWFIPLTFAIFAFAVVPGRVSFPFGLWIPWAVLVSIYLVLGDADHALQRSVMLLCPTFVGMAISKMLVADHDLAGFRRAYRALTIALWVYVVVSTGMLVTGALPDATGLSAVAMTAALLETLFAATYALGTRRDLIWWSSLALVPVIGLTRMGILVTAASLPLTLAPLRMRTRVFALAIMLIAGYGVFQSERIQRKTFSSGSGSLEDIARDDPNFAMNGRRGIWDAMESEIAREPWLGHGANASEPFVSALTGGLAHPHNDWLRLAYDYGYIGTTLFALTLAAQTLHLLARAKHASREARALFYAGASSFLVFGLFMLTDNVVLYAAFFGNLQFTIIGLAYAADASASGRRR